MSDTKELLSASAAGFATLEVGKEYQERALALLETWLTDEQYAEYVPQIEHLIQSKHWDYLLDSFYQVIPFGTGGRRGEVGIGPNRINPWTIRASAQGHSQYLLKQHGDEAMSRGVVFAYDVREFFGNQFLDDSIPNPVKNLKCVDLARAAAEVYAANGIKVFMFDGIRTTPELSFAIRHLNAVSGDVFSASHNPPEHNGKKVYDEHGGQLIPPDDEALVKEITENVQEIKSMDFEEASEAGTIQLLKDDVDQAYVEAASEVSLSKSRDLVIAYTPLHGCGSTSVVKVLRHLGFDVDEDPETRNPSGRFEHVTFNIPNPEVEQSFETPLKFARTRQADILLNSDPDADRIGLMVRHTGEWVRLDGNEIAAVLSEYVVRKRKEALSGTGVIIKTAVTTDLVRVIAERNEQRIIGDLLVGFKYVGAAMNDLQRDGGIENFLLGCEESHGYLAGNYARDKDAAVAATWLSELAAELKQENKTLLDYLADIHSRYGFFRNYLTEIRMLGAVGTEKIKKIQHELRAKPPKSFGCFSVTKVDDYLNRKPWVSETDRLSKDVLAFHLKPVDGTQSIKVTVRPSGTEPKIKMYFEIGSNPVETSRLGETKEAINALLKELERDFMNACYRLIGVDFPERGYLLFWQLPLDAKLKYFDIEPKLVELRDVSDTADRRAQRDELLAFLGSDPVEKIDAGFQAEYGAPLNQYLGLE